MCHALALVSACGVGTGAPFSGAVLVSHYDQALVAAPGGKADCVPSLLCRAGCAQGAALKAKKHEGTVGYKWCGQKSRLRWGIPRK